MKTNRNVNGWSMSDARALLQEFESYIGGTLDVDLDAMSDEEFETSCNYWCNALSAIDGDVPAGDE